MTIRINRTSIIVLIAVMAVAAVALKLLPLGTVLILAVVLACPLMMLFMHGGHGSEHHDRLADAGGTGVTKP